MNQLMLSSLDRRGLRAQSPGEKLQTIATAYQCGLNVLPVSSRVLRRERMRGHPSAQAA
jgi:hypothetical protein